MSQGMGWPIFVCAVSNGSESVEGSTSVVGIDSGGSEATLTTAAAASDPALSKRSKTWTRHSAGLSISGGHVACNVCSICRGSSSVLSLGVGISSRKGMRSSKRRPKCGATVDLKDPRSTACSARRLPWWRDLIDRGMNVGFQTLDVFRANTPTLWDRR